MKCVSCGNDISNGVLFCENCGHQVNPNSQQIRPRKKKGLLVALFSIVIIVGLAIVLAKMFLPGLLGPIDLGVKPNETAYESLMAKLNFQKDTAPTSGLAEDYKYTYGEPVYVNTRLTSEELTSFFSYNRPNYYALKKIQIRINPDDSIEFSAAVDKEYILQNILGGEHSEESIKKYLPMIKFIPGSVNVYAHFSGEIIDNKASDIEIKDVKLMGLSLPSSVFNSTEAQDEINDSLDTLLSDLTEKTGGSYESIKIEEGELILKGNLPSSLTREKIK